MKTFQTWVQFKLVQKWNFLAYDILYQVNSLNFDPKPISEPSSRYRFWRVFIPPPPQPLALLDSFLSCLTLWMAIHSLVSCEPFLADGFSWAWLLDWTVISGAPCSGQMHGSRRPVYIGPPRAPSCPFSLLPYTHTPALLTASAVHLERVVSILSSNFSVNLENYEWISLLFFQVAFECAIKMVQIFVRDMVVLSFSILLPMPEASVNWYII